MQAGPRASRSRLGRLPRLRGHRARQFFFALAFAHLRRSEADVPAENVGEVAVTGVAELERQLGQIDGRVAKTLERPLHAQAVAIAGHRLTGDAPEFAA